MILGGGIVNVETLVSTKAFIPEYRLAPEHPFPAAPTDAVACLDGLLFSGLKSVAVTGDSAGGNLALHLASGRPAALVAVVALSPVTDLTLSGDSWTSRASTDPFFTKDQVQSLVDAYLLGHDPLDAAASPLFDELVGLPPMRVHVGDAEVLLDDSLRYIERAAAAGIDAKVDVWDGMAHGFMGSVGHLDAADGALALVSSFVRERLAAHRT